MKYTLFILIAFAFITTSCTLECEKTLQGTVIDALTGETLSDIEVITEAGKNSSQGFGIFRYYESTTDNSGNFEVSTYWDLDKWIDIEIDAPQYKKVSHEFTNDGNEVCGENHVEIIMHRLSHVNLRLYDDPNLDSSTVSIYTKFKTFRSGGQVPAGDSYLIPVLEEIPNMIFINHFKEQEGFTHEDTIFVEVPRGETQIINVGL